MKKLFLLTVSALIGFILIGCVKTKPKPPVFKGVKEEVLIDLNGSFDPKEGVSVKSNVDKEIKYEVYGWNNEYTKKAGNYQVLYYAIDSGERETILSTTVYVGGKDNTFPVIDGVLERKELYEGQDKEHILNEITASYDGEDIPNNEIILENEPDYYNPGTSYVVFKLERDSKVTTKVSIVLVMEDILPTSLDSNKTINLTMAHAMGHDNTLLLNKYAASFKAKYPNVNVTIEEGKGTYPDLRDDIINRGVTATLPNIVQAYPDHIAEYLNTNKVMKLDPYIRNSRFGLKEEGMKDALEDFPVGYLVEAKGNDPYGALYSLPFSKSTEVAIYNKTVFDKLGLQMPATWQELFEDVAPKLKVEGDRIAKEKVMEKHNITTDAQITPAILDEITAAQSLVVPIAYDSTANMFITFALQWGGKYTSLSKNRTGNLHFKDDENVKAAMQYLLDNKDTITVAARWGQKYATTPFVDKQTFVTIGSNAGVRHPVNAINSARDKGQDPGIILNTAPVPYNRNMPKNRMVIQQGPNIAAFSTDDPQVNLATWLFLKHLTSREVTLDWAKGTGYIPVRNSVLESNEFKTFTESKIEDQNAAALGARMAIEQKDYFLGTVPFPLATKTRDEVGAAVVRILTGDGKIQEALDSAYDNSRIGEKK